jgi:MFS family permease
MRTRLFIGCGVVLFLQLSGQPTVLYYAPVLLQNLGYSSNDSATFATIGLGLVKVVFTFLTLCGVDRFGRRTFLIIGVCLMTVSLVTLSGLTVSFKDYRHSGCGGHDLCTSVYNTTASTHNTTQQRNTTTFSTTTDNSTLSTTTFTTDIIPPSVKTASLISLFVFVIGFSIGYGPITWLLLSEIFPTGIKGRAVSSTTSVMWLTNMLVSMTFLNAMDSIGPFGLFLIYSMVGILSIFFVCQFVPETRGKSLEVVSLELSRTFPGGVVSNMCGGGERGRRSHHVRLQTFEEDTTLLDDDSNNNNDNEANDDDDDAVVVLRTGHTQC